jgi:hypothetical protein
MSLRDVIASILMLVFLYATVSSVLVPLTDSLTERDLSKAMPFSVQSCRTSLGYPTAVEIGDWPLLDVSDLMVVGEFRSG